MFKKKWNIFTNHPASLMVFKGLFITILTVHFSILGLHQLPNNPLNHQFKYQLQGYIDPFFSQAWTLFSPNPVNSNMSLLFRFEYETASQRDTTEWIDVTEPLIEIRRESSWSPAQRISKFTQSCMSNIHESKGLILEHLEEIDSLRSDTLKTKAFYDKAMSTCYGHRATLQYSQYVAKKYFGAKGVLPDKVRAEYKIFSARFPRFSKRKEDYYDLDNYEFKETISGFIEI